MTHEDLLLSLQLFLISVSELCKAAHTPETPDPPGLRFGFSSHATGTFKVCRLFKEGLSLPPGSEYPPGLTQSPPASLSDWQPRSLTLAPQALPVPPQEGASMLFLAGSLVVGVVDLWAAAA